MRSKKPNLRPGYVPLERALSKLGLASRTQAQAMIIEGRVKLGGVIEKNPRKLVRPEVAKIEIDGKSSGKVAHRTFILHKPRGVVTTRSDEKGRPTVFSLIEGVEENLHAVGRLDMATTGLLLLTNDTKLSSYLTEPTNKIPRVYIVNVAGEFSADKIQKLLTGIVDDGEKLRAEKLELKKSSKREAQLVIELCEGKNREIRRMFLALGHEVQKLKRISFGSLELGDLALGKFRELTAAEVKKLTKHP